MSRPVPAWFPVAAVALVAAVCAGALALGDFELPAPGDAGEVCETPDDCDSHTGGEVHPKAGLWAGFGYGLNAELSDDVGRNWDAEKTLGDSAAWGWVVLVGDRYAEEVGE